MGRNPIIKNTSSGASIGRGRAAKRDGWQKALAAVRAFYYIYSGGKSVGSGLFKIREV